jgi:CheY-like chemotaxis protein
MNNNNDDASEEIIFNNNYNNINLQIGDEYWNIINKNQNNVNFNNSPTNRSSNSIRKSRKEKVNTILKQKRKYMSNKNLLNKYYNKTLSYSKSPKDMLFVIPEIAEHNKIMRPIPHPSCKLINKYVNEFTECDCKDILLVDDDEFICKTFKNILKKFKLKADCAENGKECLKMIKEKMEKNCKCDKNKYKIIFMDITMPIMDGIEAAKNIQKMIDNKEIYDNIKIIFISAHANLDLSTTVSGIKCAVDYYAKPISADKYKHLLDQYYYKG